MTDSERPHARELIAEYALGILPESEAARVRAYLASDDAAMAEYEEMANVARLLPFASEEREPATDLRPALFERIRSEPVDFPVQRARRSGLRPWLGPIAAAAAGFLVLVAGTVGYMAGDRGGDSDLQAQVASQDNLLVSVARGTHETARAGDGDVRVSVVRSPGSPEAYTLVEGLPALAEGQAYQSWFIAPGAESPEPGPVFKTANGAVWLTAGQEIGAYAAMAFTVEPESGATAPSQEPFLVVPLQRSAAAR